MIANFKTIFLSVILTVCYISCRAQLPNIISLQISPSNPTTNTQIGVVASTMFQSGSCDLQSVSVNISSQTIDVYAVHNLGPMTYICSSVDTTSIGTLESGLYKLRYHLNCNGFPATPDIDSIYFNVIPFTGLNTVENPDFFVYPNPANDYISVLNFSEKNIHHISLFNQNGMLIQRLDVNKNEFIIDISDYKRGLYIIEIFFGDRISLNKFIKL